MSDEEFKERIYEIAFGDNAINREFCETEVVNELEKAMNDAYLLSQVIEMINEGPSDKF